MRTLEPVDPDQLPEVPRIPNGLNLTPQAKGRWREIWQSPMAGEYSPADLPGIARLVTLYAMAERTDSARTLIDISRECRALESEYGCSPKSRSQMKYEFDKGQAAEERTRRRSNRSAVARVSTPAVPGAELTQADMLDRVRSAQA